MGMKYRDPETGQFKDLKVKTSDTLPVGTVVDFDGDEVPAGWEATGSDDYSTEEQFTGRYWIDGKKVYRKVVKKNSIEISTNASIPIVSHASVDTIVDLRGTYDDGVGTIRKYPLIQNTGTVLACVYYQGNIVFVGNETYSKHDNRYHTFILEYTKK